MALTGSRRGAGTLTLFGIVVLQAMPQAFPAALNTIRSGEFAHGATVGGQLRILNWNIDRGRRFESVLQAIRRQNPDICLLQEVDLHTRRTGGRDVAADLARALGMNYVFAPEFQELGQRDGNTPAYHGQAILSKLPIRRPRILRFQRQSGFWKPRSYLPDWGILQRRTGGRLALVAEFQAAGVPIVVYDLHLESRSLGHIQYEQMMEAVRDSQCYGKDTIVVFGGDLNTKYRPSIFARRLKREGFVNCLGGPRRTHVIAGDLDWIFLRGPAKAEEGRVLRDVHASDHYPLWARIQKNVK